MSAFIIACPFSVCASLWVNTTHAGTEDKKREDKERTIAYRQGVEFHDEATDEKLDKKMLAEARREDMKYSEAMVCTRKYHTRQQSKELDDDS